MNILVPIRIESVPNLREHWSARAKRWREQRASVWYSLKAAKAPVELPCTVTLTRIAPRELDSDNNTAGCKGARDAVADWLMVNDNDPRIEWRYGQRKGDPKQYALEVAFS